MTSLYATHLGEPGPWSMDDDSVVLDGLLANGFLLVGPTLDGGALAAAHAELGPSQVNAQRHSIGAQIHTTEDQRR